MEKFACKNCGSCCKKFGLKGLPLFEEEVERIKKLSEDKLDIRPTEIFIDKKSGKKFAVLYGMFNEPCPFLTENSCSIYDQRFLICKQFPVFSTEKFKFSKLKDEPEFFDCKCFDCKKHFSKGNPTKSMLKNFYSDCYTAAAESNAKTEKIMDLLVSLQELGKADLSGIDHQKISNSAEILSFSEFLKEIN